MSPKTLPAVASAESKPSRPCLRVAALGLWLALGAALAACGGEAAARPEAARRPASTASDVPEVLATIGSEPITLTDVRERIGDQLDQMEIQYRLARQAAIREVLDALLRERLLQAEAAKQGRGIDQLLEAEIGQPLTPTDAEVGAWFVENRDRLGGRTLEELRSQVVDHLREERRQMALQRLERRLMEERGVRIHLEPFRIAFDDAGAPSLGPADAPVTLVEFSDFECPFCKRFAPTLHRLEQEFGEQLRIVYRQFPLSSIHPNAFKAAEASLCAHEQGRFWAMHDLIFAEQDRVSVRDLKDKARRIVLDSKRFDACLDSGRYVEQVQEDLREGTRAGVTGTPGLFLNGVPLEGGALPYETVAEAVRRELARRGR